MLTEAHEGGMMTKADSASTGSDGLWGFFGVTFALTALTFGLMAVLQIPGPALDPSVEPRLIGFVLFAVGGFSPTIAAFLVAGVTRGRTGVRDLWKRGLRFRLGGRWYLFAIGVFFLAYGAQLLAVLLEGDSLVRPWYFDRPMAILVNLPAILLLGPVSEEYGWRGFALDRLLSRWARPVANLLLGALWAVWHLPLFFVPGTSQAQLGRPLPSFGLFSLQILALTFVYTWIYRRTDRSIWSAVFLHFLTAFVFFLASGFIDGGGSFVSPVSIGVFVVIAVAVTVREDRRAQ